MKSQPITTKKDRNQEILKMAGKFSTQKIADKFGITSKRVFEIIKREKAKEKGWITPGLTSKMRALLRCIECKVDFRELEPHIFAPECECMPENIRISVG